MPSAPTAAKPTNPEIVIVGAGAAGVGAGLALTRLGIPFVILEAKHRVGGRAFTDTQSIGHPWDQGCFWFHAAEHNPLRMIAKRIGHPFVSKSEDWSAQWFVEGAPLSASEQDAAGSVFGAALAAAEAAGLAGRDISLAEAAGGFAEPYGPFAKFVFEAIGSGPAEASSAVDAARYDGGTQDFPVSGGYGRLIERLADGLPIQLACPVQTISRLKDGFSVQTTHGSLRPRAVILTVSNTVLSSGQIKLDPALPADLQQALADLPCGDCEKIGLELTGDALAEFADGKVRARHGGEIYSLQVRPFGRPLVIAYAAGENAKRIGAMPAPEAGALLTEILASIYGNGLRSGTGRASVSNWSRDPHILGAYSYAKTGRAAARPGLLAADLAPLFLAGEAHLLDWFSTAHGAHVSGVAAAHKAAAFLGRPPITPDPLWLPPALLVPQPLAT